MLFRSAGLYFIEDEEGGAWFDAAVRFDAESCQQAGYIEVFGEKAGHALIVLEIDIGHMGKGQVPEFLEQPGFADLPGSPEHQGFAMGCGLP